MKNTQNRRTNQTDYRYVVLSPSQIDSIKTLEKAGWHLQFIRHCHSYQVIPLLKNERTGKTATVHIDGRIDLNHSLYTREIN